MSVACYQPTVSRVSKRFQLADASPLRSIGTGDALPIGKRRYSRLETCATTDRRASHISLLSISCHHRRLPKRMTKLYASGSASRFQQFGEAFNVKHAEIGRAHV